MNKKQEFLPIFCLSIIFITVVISLLYNPRAAFMENFPVTAYEYPSIDMGAFFERANDSEYLENDFYTNAISEPNPRWVFGYFILALASIFGTDWYSILFFLKVFFSISLPAIFFLLVYLKLQKEGGVNLTAILVSTAIICWAAYSDDIFDIFSIAIWHPIYGYAIPQNIGILLSLTSCILLFYGKNRNILVFFLFLFSAFIHPVSTLFASIFFILMNYDLINTRKISLLIISYSISITTLLVFFHESSNLSNSDFIEHYVFNRLPFHYVPSRYESSGIEWIDNFILLNAMLITLFIIGFIKKYTKLKYLSLLALISYSGCILEQYIFVEKLMIKPFAILGISRFSMFGFWMLVICFSYFIQISFKSKKTYRITSIGKISYIFVTIIILFSISFTYFFKDNPKEWVINNNKPLYSWIDKNIAKDDVIAVPEMVMGLNMQLIAKRAVFSNRPIGPVLFNESSLKEDKERYEALFGNYKEQIELEDKFPSLALAALNYYHNITPEKVTDISKKYRLDYILFVNKMGRPKNFTNQEPVYKNNKYTIYKISLLK